MSDDQWTRRWLLKAGAVSSAFAVAQPGPSWASASTRRNLDVSDFGAVGDGSTDDTRALQNALDAALSTNRKLFVAAGTYACRGLSCTISGGNMGSGFGIVGEGVRATKLRKLGTSDEPVLSVVASVQPTEANLFISDISFDGGATQSDGIRLTGLAHSTLLRVIAENCDRALDLRGSLVLLVEDCTLHRSRIGARLRKEGISRANSITFRSCKINLNSAHGIDFGEGSLLRVRDCQIEANGSASRADSGAIVLRSNLSEEFGYSMVVIEGCWLEANRGWGLFTEHNSGLLLAIRDTQILSSESGRAIRVEGISHCSLENIMVPSPGDLVDVDCDKLSVSGGLIARLTGSQRERVVANTSFGD